MEELPLSIVANHLAQAFMESDNLIVIGETGCGKSTQIPKVLFELMDSCKLPSTKKMIGVTEPRRIAAITLATRVQEELMKSNPAKCHKLAGLVGHHVRFSDTTTPRTKICFLTEATLLRTTFERSFFMEYDVIIVDEAHERSLSLDALMGALKYAQMARNKDSFCDPKTGIVGKQPLKIIVMTATGDADKFQEYLPSSRVLLVSGKKYPVTVKYSRLPDSDYLTATTALLMSLHRNLPPDQHILVFLTGQDEIEGVVETLQTIVFGHKTFVCPMYAALPPSAHSRAYLIPPTGTRKIVIATNVAETSLTIPGIRVVVDCGYAKTSYHLGRTGIETLKVDRISKSEANQRAGRAGREYEGVVYRVYTKDDFDDFLNFHTPAVRKSDLTSYFMTLLRIHESAWKDSILEFPFFERPTDLMIQETFDNLKALGVVIGTNFTDGKFTGQGKLLASIPLAPQLARVALESCGFGVMPEVCAILSLVECDHLYEFTPNNGKRAKMASYVAQEGDLLTYYNLMKQYLKEKDKKQWCESCGLLFRSMVYADQVRKQLIEILKSLGLDSAHPKNDDQSVRINILRCFMKSLPLNVARLSPNGSYYEITDGNARAPLRARISHQSFLYESRPPMIMFTKLTYTSQRHLFMHNCLVHMNLESGG